MVNCLHYSPELEIDKSTIMEKLVGVRISLKNIWPDLCASLEILRNYCKDCLLRGNYIIYRFEKTLKYLSDDDTFLVFAPVVYSKCKPCNLANIYIIIVIPTVTVPL